MFITDNSADVIEVQQRDVVEAIAKGSILKLFHQLLGFSDFIISYILRIFPRTDLNPTYASAHYLAQKLVHKRVTRSRCKEFSSFRSRRYNFSDLQQSSSTVLNKKNDKNNGKKLPQRRSHSNNHKGSALSKLLGKHSHSIVA